MEVVWNVSGNYNPQSYLFNNINPHEVSPALQVYVYIQETQLFCSKVSTSTLYIMEACQNESIFQL